MDPKVDDLLQKGLAEHRWDSVVEELRRSGTESGADPAAIVLDQVRAEVSELIDRLSKASSVREVNRVGNRLNERIVIMKGLESAIAERSRTSTSAV
jgi:SpoVK/Ycf46/Vps4 family AAA+-type ATPase